MNPEYVGFYVITKYAHHEYGIAININNHYYTSNTFIAKLLDMSVEEYEDLACLFKDFNFRYFNSMYFPKKQNAQKFADYLNDKYLVLIKLQGKL